jgi:hypothetical protein
MTCTGSEANDIALRMAQAVTGKTGIIATDNTYHGNTGRDIGPVDPAPADRGLSGRMCGWCRRPTPAPGGRECRARHRPSPQRGPGDCGTGGGGVRLLGHDAVPGLRQRGDPHVRPDFLDPTVAVVRRAGGLLIADEVQPGFGRLGSHFWGHDWLGFAPDVVTVGKPMANGIRWAPCWPRPEVMAAFREAFGYFNTFGGNPVSAAACLAVLDVIEDEGLQENARRVGAYMLERTARAAPPAAGRGARRGAVLWRGVRHRCRDDPGHRFVAEVVERMVARGVPDEPDRAGGQHAEDAPADAVFEGQRRFPRGYARRGAGRGRGRGMMPAEALALAREAQAAWGAGGEPRPITLRENAVFAVEVPDVGPAALRLHRRGYQTEDSIRSELWWMEALADAGVEVPRPLYTTDGAVLHHLADGRIASALSWTEGEPVGAALVPLPGTAAGQMRLHASIGRAVAELHVATDRLHLPAWFQRPHWDIEGLVGRGPVLGPVLGASRRDGVRARASRRSSGRGRATAA